MAITTGVEGKLYINTGTEGTPNYTFIGGQRSASIDFNYESTDVTTKADSGWEKKIGTTRSGNIDLEGFVDSGDAGFLALADVFWSNKGASTATQVLFRFVTPWATTYTGKYNLAKLNENHQMKEGVGYKASLESSGIITKVG